MHTILSAEPKSVIKHCLSRITSAREFTDADVEEDTPNMYHVNSAHNAGHKYSVILVNEQNMPSCDCLDFSKTCMPCKHIFAVLAFTEKTWHDLPSPYINNPYMILEDHSLSFEDSSTTWLPLPDYTLHQPEDLADGASCPSSYGIQAARARFREILKLVEDASFLVTEKDVLEDMTCEVEKTLVKLLQYAPKQEGIATNTPVNTVKRKATRQLPMNKKRQKGKKARGEQVVIAEGEY